MANVSGTGKHLVIILWYTYDLFIRHHAYESGTTNLINLSKYYLVTKLEFPLHWHYDNDISVIRTMMMR